MPLRSVGDMSRCDSALIGSALAIWAMAATGPESWNSTMPSLGRLATLGMAKAPASTLTVPAGTLTSPLVTSTPKVEPDSTTLPDALVTAGTLPIVVKVTFLSCMSRRMALSGSRTGLPHSTPAGTDAS